MIEEKYAIYDFCQTLVDFETADEFIDFICNQRNDISFGKILKASKIHVISNIVGHFTHRSFYKMLNLRRIKGINQTAINDYAKLFYEKKIKPHFIRQMIKRIEIDKANGYKIVILSASYEPILKLFGDEFGIDYLITNQFRYDSKNRFTGRLKNKDCIYKEKVKRFSKMFGYNVLPQSIAYGDSRSDLPILKSVRVGIVVSHKKHKEWVEDKLKEIIWNEGN